MLAIKRSHLRLSGDREIIINSAYLNLHIGRSLFFMINSMVFKNTVLFVIVYQLEFIFDFQYCRVHSSFTTRNHRWSTRLRVNIAFHPHRYFHYVIISYISPARFTSQSLPFSTPLHTQDHFIHSTSHPVDSVLSRVEHLLFSSRLLTRVPFERLKETTPANPADETLVRAHTASPRQRVHYDSLISECVHNQALNSVECRLSPKVFGNARCLWCSSS